jgi:hypothetical protein
VLTIIAVALTWTTYAEINISRNLSSSGSITVSANLGVYSDSGCQNAITTLDWGTITPGGTITRTVYIKNTGTGVSLSLNMTTSTWNPTNANGPIAITWDREGTRLQPGQSTAVALTLTVSPSITGITNFSVQISITGTG